MSDRAQRTTIGVPGLTHYAGYVSEEWDRRLQGTRGVRAYREMAEGSPTIGALLFAFESLVRQAGYRVEPADESTEAEREATFVTECIEDMEGSWGETVADILSMIVYGYALLEVVYKQRTGPTWDTRSSMYDDQRIGWARWSPRAQDTIVRWLFDDEGRAVSAYQQAPPSYREVEIPLDKCLHFRVRARKNSPEGLSLLRNAYEPWYYWKHIARIEAIGIERDLAGLPVVRIPIDVIRAGGADLDTWDRVVTQLRRDEQAGLRLPSDRDDHGQLLYDVSLLTTGGTRQVNTDPILARYERLMLRSVLADFLTQGDTGVGSYAQSVNRTDLYLMAVRALLDAVADVINAQGIRRLFAVNNLDMTIAPRFVFNDVSRKDLTGFAQTLVSLIGAGVVDPGEPDLKSHVYDVFDLPLPEETDEQAEDESGTDGDDADDDPVEDEDARPGPDRPTETTPRKAVEPDAIERAVALFKRHAPAEYADLIEAEVAE